MRVSARDTVKIAFLGASLGATLLVSTVARADAPDDVRARADAEFEDAKKLMDAGQIAAACTEFAHSQQLDPKLGRLLNLAFCHEAEGKTATAWREYNEATALAEQKGQKERVEFAREHAAAVAKKMALLHLELPEGVASVEVDGASLPHDVWAAPMPLDPGEHTVVVAGPGKKARTTTVTLARAPGLQTTVIAAMESDGSIGPTLAPPPPPQAPPAVVASPPSSAPPASEEPSTPSRGTVVPAVIATGVGVAGLGVGIVFGLGAASKKSEADAHCPAKLCDSEGSRLVSDARSSATVSSIGFGVALVSAAAATWLFVRPPGGSPSSARLTPVITTRSAGLGVEGSW